MTSCYTFEKANLVLDRVVMGSWQKDRSDWRKAVLYLMKIRLCRTTDCLMEVRLFCTQLTKVYAHGRNVLQSVVLLINRATYIHMYVCTYACIRKLININALVSYRHHCRGDVHYFRMGAMW